MDVTKIISWLPFNESATQDLLGGTWTANGSPTIKDGVLNLPTETSYISKDDSITLGGKDFTIACDFYMATETGNWPRVFILFKTTGTDNNAIGLARRNTGSEFQLVCMGATANFTSTLEKWHNVEFDYSHEDGKFFTFIDGVLVSTITKTIEETVFDFTYIGRSNYNNGGRFVGKVSQFMILDGVALHTENFTPPTASEYADWQLEVTGYAPIKTFFDVETYLRNAQKGWRVYNPGEAELLATEGATTVEVPYTQSVTGKAFYGGTLSDMFHTPAGLKEIWIRFDFVATSYADSSLRVGHWSGSSSSIVGLGGSAYAYSQYNRITFNGTTILNPVFNQRYKCLLHIKSDAANGLVELTIDKDTYTTTGNVNDGNDLNNLVVLNTSKSILFSNVVVSETELTFDDGWNRKKFGVETKITAPVLNIRMQGSNVKFPLTTKRKANSLTIHVGDRNFYNTSVATDSTLAGAARYLLDDEARALSTSVT